MKPPPHDIDRDNFVMNVGWRNTAHLATLRFSDGVLEIVPRPLPRANLIALNLTFLACALACAFALLPRFHVHSPYALPFLSAASLVACLSTTTMIVWSHRHEQRSGAWMIYDSNQGIIRLPRHEVEFSRAELFHIEEITTRSLQNPTWHMISELNIVAVIGSRRHRWNLLKSDAADGAFSHLLIPMRRCVDLPIVRLRGSGFDWKVRRIPL